MEGPFQNHTKPRSLNPERYVVVRTSWEGTGRRNVIIDMHQEMCPDCMESNVEIAFATGIVYYPANPDM